MYIVDGIAYAGEVNQPLAVVAVQPLDDYKLRVRFSTGEERVFAFGSLLDKGVFKALRDKAVFDDVRIDFGVPSWDDGKIDIAPEYLYEYGAAADP